MPYRVGDDYIKNMKPVYNAKGHLVGMDSWGKYMWLKMFSRRAQKILIEKYDKKRRVDEILGGLGGKE
jgi:hypothetical protein